MDLLIAGGGGLTLVALIFWIAVLNRRHDKTLTPEQRKDLKAEVEDRMAEW